MNYQEALAYIYSFSNFERSGIFTRDYSEDQPRMHRLMELFDNPYERYASTLIAGTKGKGSTAAMIESVLRAAGLRTGLYTQPDLHTFRERIRVNGRLISGDEVAQIISELRLAVDEIQAKYALGPFITYEISTALAFLYFWRRRVEHAVLEVGLGGRLDVTNITHPLVSVITSISYDHMQFLGNTLEQIAREKAGIIKPGGMVTTSAQDPAALLAIATVSQQQVARMVRVGSFDGDMAQEQVDAGLLPPVSYCYRLQRRDGLRQYFTVWTPERVYSDLELPLAGDYQLENATLALATLEMLRERGVVWDEAALRGGLATVHWPARIQVVGRQPTIVVDGAHNADSMQKLVQALRSSFTLQRLIVVLSTNKDKDQAGIVQMLSDIDCVVLTSMRGPRTTSIATLSALFTEYAPHVQVHTTEDSQQAMELALELANEQDLICATGSLYLTGEVLRWAAARGDQDSALEIEGVDHP